MTGQHLKRSGLADDKNKRSRTTFNAAQINALEKIFAEQKYPDQTMREKIAERLEMEEQKVVIWFQNRRAKYKRNNRSGNMNTNRLQGTQRVGQHRVLGGNFKRDDHHVNLNGAYSSAPFQDRGFYNPYNADNQSQMMHGSVNSVDSTSQEQCTTNDALSDAFHPDGFLSSPEPVTSSADVEVVSSSLKQDKPLIQEAPPNQICTNAGSQDEMRQALLQWTTRQNMSSKQPNQFSSKAANNVAPQNTPIHEQSHFYDEIYISSSSSSGSESEEEENQINRENTHYKNYQNGNHQIPSTNFRRQQIPLYLDIPSVSSGDVSSPAPHSTTSTASWPSTSDISSVEPASPTQAPSFDQKPLSDITRINIPAPTAANWSGTYNNAPTKQTYVSDMPNQYVQDLLQLRRHGELPMQQCRRRLKLRRSRHEEKRKYPNRTNGHSIDKYQHYPHNMDMSIRKSFVSRERIFEGQRAGFSLDDSQRNIRPQCKYAQSTYPEYQEDRQKHHQRHSKRRQFYNNRLQYPDNLEYSIGQMTNNNMMASVDRQQTVERNENLNGFRSNDFCTLRDAPKNTFNFQGSTSTQYPEPFDQNRNSLAYTNTTWNNPIMEVNVPIPPRRPKQPQPHREENGVTNGVVHHYGDTDELTIPPLQVDSVSDLSQNLNADQSATLNRVLESVVKDIFPFSDNFISI